MQRYFSRTGWNLASSWNNNWIDFFFFWEVISLFLKVYTARSVQCQSIFPFFFFVDVEVPLGQNCMLDSGSPVLSFYSYNVLLVQKPFSVGYFSCDRRWDWCGVRQFGMSRVLHWGSCTTGKPSGCWRLKDCWKGVKMACINSQCGVRGGRRRSLRWETSWYFYWGYYWNFCLD